MSRQHAAARIGFTGLVVAGLLATAGPAGVQPATAARVVACPAAEIEVEAGSAKSAQAACEAAHRAIRFMRDHGFVTIPRLRISLVSELPRRHDVVALGQYDARADRIQVLAYASCAQAAAVAPAFGIDMTPELHQSFVAHEVAHAVAQANLGTARPAVEAQEYIAYTVQLSVMHADLRRAVLTAHPVPGFADETEINLTYLALNPSAFAVKAYKHHIRLPQPDAFYRRLLSNAYQPSQGWE